MSYFKYAPPPQGVMKFDMCCCAGEYLLHKLHRPHWTHLDTANTSHYQNQILYTERKLSVSLETSLI